MKIAICIQARISSNRLPAKALLRFNGTTILGNIINILSAYGFPKEDIYILTSDHQSDNILVYEFSEINIFRGPLENVYERYRMFSLVHEYDYIIRLTADNPMPQMNIIDRLIQNIVHNQTVSLITTRYYENSQIHTTVSKGNNVDCIKADSLNSYASNVITEFQREHTIPIFLEFNDYVTIDCSDLSGPPLTVDTLSDYLDAYLRI